MTPEHSTNPETNRSASADVSDRYNHAPRRPVTEDTVYAAEVFASYFVRAIAGESLIVMRSLSYGYVKKIQGVGFDEALAKVTDLLKREGFGVLTEIDVESTFKVKLGVKFRRYRILGACNPDLAHQALTADEHIGLLLPCNVVVQELPSGEVEVSIADPKAMFTLVDRQDVAGVAEEADKRLRRIVESLP